VILVVIVAIVLAVVLSRNNASTSGGASGYDGPTIGIPSGIPATGNSSRASALLGSPDVATLLKGIPQKGMVLGKPNAPVTLVEYIDLQCSACDQFETTEFSPLVRKYVRTGKMKILMKTWNIIDANFSGVDDSLRGQKATIAAGKQNKAFNFAQVLYDNQGGEGSGWLNNAMVANIAASVDGLKLDQLAQDANSSATQDAIRRVEAAAVAGRFSATPTILLAKTGQTPKVVSSGVPALPTLESQIDALLNQKK
jgi:protein-disulfide isomerase